MRRRRREEKEEVFPDNPPDPKVARQQIAARRRDLEKYLKSEILPRVNAALGSEEHVDYRAIGVRHLWVYGSRQSVVVMEDTGDWGWIEPLLKMLRSGPYRGYSVTAEGLWHYSRRPSRNRQRTKLDEKDIERSLSKLRKSYRNVRACVRIIP